MRYRGWARGPALFGGRPVEGVSWYRATLDHADLQRVEYIKYWVDEGYATHRTASVAVAAIKDSSLADPRHQTLQAIADDLRQGHLPEPPILVTDPTLGRLVILEDHFRLTAYLLGEELLPPEVAILLRVSDRISEWSEW